MIDLGLSRVIKLLSVVGNPHLTWKAVHVAGTNGKGSVCAYISSCINEAKIPNGRFTSPHLINRFDCISINGEPVKEQLFLDVENAVTKANADNDIQATDFELLTVIAFEIFHRQKISLAVIEVGLGGRLDSTNVLTASQTLCTVITKIGLDHQNFLGNTLSQIAREKGGIIKQGIPCVLDGTNDSAVIKEIENIANEKKSSLTIAQPLSSSKTASIPFQINPSITPLLGSYQMSNLSCSLQALLHIQKHFPLTNTIIQQGIRETKWPGRLQWVDLSSSFKVLIDGAHNNQAAELLADYINSSVRPNSPSSQVTFILAFSQGKDFQAILNRLIQPNDNIIATKFSSVDGMPWVKPCDPDEIIATASSLTDKTHIEENIESSINKAKLLSSSSNTVVCGSLYLVSDFLRSFQ